MAWQVSIQLGLGSRAQRARPAVVHLLRGLAYILPHLVYMPLFEFSCMCVSTAARWVGSIGRLRGSNNKLSADRRTRKRLVRALLRCTNLEATFLLPGAPISSRLATTGGGGLELQTSATQNMELKYKLSITEIV
jgi:hypothetical protein